MKLMRLRYDGSCHLCAAAIPARTQAWWDRAEKRVTCVNCRGADDPAPAGPAESVGGPPQAVDVAVVVMGEEPIEVSGPPPVPESTPEEAEDPPTADPVEPLLLDDADRGIAGASARAERQRRSQKRDEAVRSKHPKIGGFLLAAFDDPTSTKVWDQGAVGEERVGGTLEQARARGIEVLHDRAIPRSRANIDHLAITPSGVWVIDAKRYLNGKLERRDVGGFFKTDHRLYIGGRDKTPLVHGVRKQMDIVATALEGTDFAEVPVRGALCFVDVQLGWFAKPFTIKGVNVTWRKHLVEPMLTSVTVDEANRHALTHFLAGHFKQK